MEQFAAFQPASSNLRKYDIYIHTYIHMKTMNTSDSVWLGKNEKDEVELFHTESRYYMNAAVVSLSAAL